MFVFGAKDIPLNKDPAKCGVFVMIDIKLLLLNNVGCSRPFFAFDNVEGYPSAFLQRLKTISLDCAVMNENVLAAILLDKTKTF